MEKFTTVKNIPLTNSNFEVRNKSHETIIIGVNFVVDFGFN